MGLPGLHDIGCTESTNVNALVRSCRLADLTFDATGGVLAIGGNVMFTHIFSASPWGLVLSGPTKTAPTEEESTIVGDQLIFYFLQILHQHHTDLFWPATNLAGVNTKWYFNPADSKLLGYEVSTDREDDPCEIHSLHYNKDSSGKELVYKIFIKSGDKEYAFF